MDYIPNDHQISMFEKQCSYIPLLMSKSRAVRKYLIGIGVKLIFFILFCALVKWNEKYLPLLIIYSAFFLIHTYVIGFRCMRMHMINHMDKAVIIDTGVIAKKAHHYPEGLNRILQRQSHEDLYYSSLEVLSDKKQKKWYPCTDVTYEHAVPGDRVIILEFPEEFELGKYCCFLEELIL